MSEATEPAMAKAETPVLVGCGQMGPAMLRGWCNEESERQDQQTEDSEIGDLYPYWQRLEVILKDALKLEAEQHLRPQHLHAEFVKGCMDGQLKSHDANVSTQE